MASVVEPSMGESSMAGICERSMIGIGEDSISHVVGSRTVIGSGGQSSALIEPSESIPPLGIGSGLGRSEGLGLPESRLGLAYMLG